MLDHMTLALLDNINLNCQSGGYKVFLLKDLILDMPSAFDMSEQALIECLETLKNHQYISIKYQDDVEVCLMPLTKGKIESEKRLDQEIEKIKYQKQYFWAGFLGAIIGGWLIGLIHLILCLVGGV